MGVLSDVERIAQRAADAVRRRANAMLRRVVVTRVDDSTAMQSLQVEALGESEGDVEHFQPQGFYSVPYAGSDAIVLRIGGAAGHQVAVLANKRDKRVIVEDATEGDVVIYQHSSQIVIHLRADGDLRISGPGKCSVDFGEVVLAGESASLEDGVVTGRAIDTLTGATLFALGSTSARVKAVKV